MASIAKKDAYSPPEEGVELADEAWCAGFFFGSGGFVVLGFEFTWRKFEEALVEEVLAVALEFSVLGLGVFQPRGAPFFGGLLGELGVNEFGVID